MFSFRSSLVIWAHGGCHQLCDVNFGKQCGFLAELFCGFSPSVCGGGRDGWLSLSLITPVSSCSIMTELHESLVEHCSVVFHWRYSLTFSPR